MFDAIRAGKALAMAREGRKTSEIVAALDADPKTVRAWVQKLDPEYYPKWIRRRYRIHDPAAIEAVMRAAPDAISFADLQERTGVSRQACASIVRQADPALHGEIVRRAHSERNRKLTAQSKERAAWDAKHGARMVAIFEVKVGNTTHAGDVTDVSCVRLAARLSGLTEDEVRASKRMVKA